MNFKKPFDAEKIRELRKEHAKKHGRSFKEKAKTFVNIVQDKHPDFCSYPHYVKFESAINSK